MSYYQTEKTKITTLMCKPKYVKTFLVKYVSIFSKTSLAEILMSQWSYHNRDEQKLTVSTSIKPIKIQKYSITIRYYFTPKQLILIDLILMI